MEAGAHKVIGIDPGSYFWKFCVLDDNEILARERVSTGEISRDPGSISGILAKHMEGLEALAAPSGHGLPTTTIDNVGQEELSQMTLKREKTEIVGLASSIDLLKDMLAGTDIKCFILPSVKHLASVPPWRKINVIDLGTADKVCSSAFTLQRLSEDRSKDFDEITFVLAEIGHAFLAMICVENGRIVDGIGGTTASFGTRASGAVDAELVHVWDFPEKSSIYTGGLVHASGMSLREIEDRLPGELGERGTTAMKRFLEAFISDLAAISTRNDVSELVLNSVLGPKFNELLREEISRCGFSLSLSLDDEMPGCTGAAYLANGLIGGRYEGLAEHLGIKSSRGSIMEAIYFSGRPKIP